MTKDRNILAIKGLAIIGVVLHHLVNRRENIQASEWIEMLLLMFHWCVLAFICASGYLQAFSDSRRVKGVGEFLLLRFNRLLVPWLSLIIVFALIWQSLALLHVPNVGVKIPSDFFSKIAVSLWPVDATVGEQLYYLPILFAASVIFIIVRAAFGVPGVWVVTVACFLAGETLYPRIFLGFKLGTLVWSLGFYATGYLLFQYRDKVSHIRITLAVVTVILVIFSGPFGVLRSVPLWLIAEGSYLKLPSIPGICSLGEASGTIYIYHTPFVLQPLVIVATLLHGAVPQLIGALGAGAAAMLICYIFHQALKDTRAKVLLM